eukprot:362159-Chlamydomonas_euryale.AAC.20
MTVAGTSWTANELKACARELGHTIWHCDRWLTTGGVAGHHRCQCMAYLQHNLCYANTRAAQSG